MSRNMQGLPPPQTIQAAPQGAAPAQLAAMAPKAVGVVPGSGPKMTPISPPSQMPAASPVYHQGAPSIMRPIGRSVRY